MDRFTHDKENAPIEQSNIPVDASTGVKVPTPVSVVKSMPRMNDKEERKKKRKSLGRRVSFAPDNELTTHFFFEKSPLRKAPKVSLSPKQDQVGYVLEVDATRQGPSQSPLQASPSQMTGAVPMDLTAVFRVDTSPLLAGRPSVAASVTAGGVEGDITLSLPGLCALAEEDAAWEQGGNSSHVRGRRSSGRPSAVGLPSRRRSSFAHGDLTAALPSLASLAEEDEVYYHARRDSMVLDEAPALEQEEGEGEEDMGAITARLPLLSALAEEDEAMEGNTTPLPAASPVPMTAEFTFDRVTRPPSATKRTPQEAAGGAHVSPGLDASPSPLVASMPRSATAVPRIVMAIALGANSPLAQSNRFSLGGDQQGDITLAMTRLGDLLAEEDAGQRSVSLTPLGARNATPTLFQAPRSALLALKHVSPVLSPGLSPIGDDAMNNTNGGAGMSASPMTRISITPPLSAFPTVNKRAATETIAVEEEEIEEELVAQEAAPVDPASLPATNHSPLATGTLQLTDYSLASAARSFASERSPGLISLPDEDAEAAAGAMDQVDGDEAAAAMHTLAPSPMTNASTPLATATMTRTSGHTEALVGKWGFLPGGDDTMHVRMDASGADWMQDGTETMMMHREQEVMEEEVVVVDKSVMEAAPAAASSTPVVSQSPITAHALLSSGTARTNPTLASSRVVMGVSDVPSGLVPWSPFSAPRSAGGVMRTIAGGVLLTAEKVSVSGSKGGVTTRARSSVLEEVVEEALPGGDELVPAVEATAAEEEEERFRSEKRMRNKRRLTLSLLDETLHLDQFDDEEEEEEEEAGEKEAETMDKVEPADVSVLPLVSPVAPASASPAIEPPASKRRRSSILPSMDAPPSAAPSLLSSPVNFSTFGAIPSPTQPSTTLAAPASNMRRPMSILRNSALKQPRNEGDTTMDLLADEVMGGGLLGGGGGNLTRSQMTAPLSVPPGSNTRLLGMNTTQQTITRPPRVPGASNNNNVTVTTSLVKTAPIISLSPTPQAGATTQQVRFVLPAAAPPSASRQPPRTGGVTPRRGRVSLSSPSLALSMRGDLTLTHSTTTLTPHMPVPLTFADFLREAEVQFLDQLRRGASIGFGDLATDPPPATLRDSYKLLCVTAAQVGKYESGVRLIQEEIGARKQRIASKDEALSRENPDVFRRVQLADEEELLQLRASLQLLKKVCRGQTVLAWKEWRLKAETKLSTEFKTRRGMLEGDVRFLSSCLHALAAVSTASERLQASQRAQGVARGERRRLAAEKRARVIATQARLTAMDEVQRERQAQMIDLEAQLASVQQRRAALQARKEALLARREELMEQGGGGGAVSAATSDATGVLFPTLRPDAEDVTTRLGRTQFMAARKQLQSSTDAAWQSLDIAHGLQSFRLESLATHSATGQLSHVCLRLSARLALRLDVVGAMVERVTMELVSSSIVSSMTGMVSQMTKTLLADALREANLVALDGADGQEGGLALTFGVRGAGQASASLDASFALVLCGASKGRVQAPALVQRLIPLLHTVDAQLASVLQCRAAAPSLASMAWEDAQRSMRLVFLDVHREARVSMTLSCAHNNSHQVMDMNVDYAASDEAARITKEVMTSAVQRVSEREEEAGRGRRVALHVLCATIHAALQQRS